MKNVQIGKRYSKVSVPVAEEGDTPPETLGEFLRLYCGDSQRDWKDYANEVHAAAVGCLESEGLLTAPMVYRWGDMEQWTTEPIPDDLPDDTPWGHARLSHYVSEQGYKRDSQADIAARIIQKAHALQSARENANIDEAINASMELGILSQLLLVYSVEDDGRDKGRNNRWQATRDDKSDALEWWAKHRGEYTKDDAATELSELYGRPWRTVRDWLKGA